MARTASLRLLRRRRVLAPPNKTPRTGFRFGPGRYAPIEAFARHRRCQGVASSSTQGALGRIRTSAHGSGGRTSFRSLACSQAYVRGSRYSVPWLCHRSPAVKEWTETSSLSGQGSDLHAGLTTAPCPPISEPTLANVAVVSQLHRSMPRRQPSAGLLHANPGVFAEADRS